jgi:hypothetical protein
MKVRKLAPGASPRFRAEQTAALAADVRPWPGGEMDHVIQVKPLRVTGRRIRQAR